MTNSVDPDRSASSEANWSGLTLFANAGYIKVQQDRVKEKGPQTLIVTSVKGVKEANILPQILCLGDMALCTFHNSFVWRPPFCQSCHVTK